MIKYGVIFGRFQPFHLGHQMYINEIVSNGFIPVIFIGSVNKNDEKNPLTFSQRKILIDAVYPNVEKIIIPLNDHLNWDNWFKEIENKLKKISEKKNEFLFFYYNKEKDRYKKVQFKGKTFENIFYNEIFKIEGYNLKPVEFMKLNKLKIQIDATDIRNNLEKNKLYLDCRVYKKLKEFGWK